MLPWITGCTCRQMTLPSATPLSAKKSCRLADGGGMYLEVSPTGGKCWRFKYRFAGKESFDDTRAIA
ncbi:Arm DNA-binding domain-containing protein [Burkholderia gladioli]|uniref:Arm DNA-binding domain-containing protein n=1 Tax=Burkholderia gladioli TaxID=28095 RepID=UPI003C7BA509